MRQRLGEGYPYGEGGRVERFICFDVVFASYLCRGKVSRSPLSGGGGAGVIGEIVVEVVLNFSVERVA
jgi:hypothetical protein